jgi:hypothetical protein
MIVDHIAQRQAAAAGRALFAHATASRERVHDRVERPQRAAK